MANQTKLTQSFQAPATTFSWPQVCARRMARQGLEQPAAAERLVEQVSVMCGAHAQVMAAAEISIALRVTGTTQSTVRAALSTTHDLIKTYGPRGTVHLLPAQDLALWTGALGAIPQPRSGQPAEVRLSAEQTEAVVAAIAEVLAEAALTLNELGEAIAARVGSWAGERTMLAFNDRWPRWRQAIGPAASRGLLCFGPNRGKNVTYTNPRRWLPGFEPMAGPAALATVVQRYLHAYGPATPAEFAQWLGAPRPWAAALFASLASQLERVTRDSATAWVNAGDTEPPAEPPHGLRLLPYFDVYAVGCHPRERVFPGQASTRALANGAAGNFPVLLNRGIVAGIWHQRRTGHKLAITVESFGKLSRSQWRELEDQAALLGVIEESEPVLAIGPVNIGRHA